MFIFFDLFELIALDDQMAVAADPFHVVILNANILVLFGMYEYLFTVSFILESQFVKSAALLDAISLNRRFKFFVRKSVWRHRFRVIHAPRHYRFIRISIQKIDDDFHADPGYEHGSPVVAGPALCYAHPA